MYMSGNAHCIQIFHSIQSHLIIPFLIWLHFVFLWVHSKPLHCYFFVVCAETTLSDVHRLIRKKSLIKFVLCPNCTSSGPQLQIRKLLSRLDERFCRESMYLDLTNQQSIWGWNDNFKNFSNKKKNTHIQNVCLEALFHYETNNHCSTMNWRNTKYKYITKQIWAQQKLYKKVSRCRKWHFKMLSSQKIRCVSETRLSN